jgi:hypothetical protein
LSTGPDKFVSEAGTSRTAKQWRDSRHDQKRKALDYKLAHGGKDAPTREQQFDNAIAAFFEQHIVDLKAAGYQRDLFTWMLDIKFFSEYAKTKIDFERDKFQYMVNPTAIDSLIH